MNKPTPPPPQQPPTPPAVCPTCQRTAHQAARAHCESRTCTWYTCVCATTYSRLHPQDYYYDGPPRQKP